MSRDYDFVPYKSFYMVPEPSLTAMARDYLFGFASINNPKTTSCNSGIFPLPVNANSCVVAEKGRLSINFGSAAIQGWIMSDLADIESIVEEARRNIAEDPEIPPSTVAVYDQLEQETRVFLDHLTGGEALNEWEVMYSTERALRDLHLDRVW